MEQPVLLIARPGPTRNLLEALLQEEGLRWQTPDTGPRQPSEKFPVLHVCGAGDREKGIPVPRFVVASGFTSLATFLEAGTRDGMTEDRVHAAPDECRVRLRRCFGAGGTRSAVTGLPCGDAPQTQGPWRLDIREGTLSHANGPLVRLTPTEARLAAALLSGRGSVMSHEQLAWRVWADRDCHVPDLLKRYVSRLRRRLGELGGTIRNVPGRGYAWRET